MRKLYENFHIFYFQKRIVSTETIRGNSVPVLRLKYFIFSKQGQQQNKEVMSGLDSDDETDSDGTIDDKYNLCKEKGPSRRSLAIQSGCKVNRHYFYI